MNPINIFISIAVLFVLAWTFRRMVARQDPVARLRREMRPPAHMAGLSDIIVKLDEWKKAGKITSQEHEKLLLLCKEESSRPHSPLSVGISHYR
ncbi:MAG TPA: hypothetical protein PK876_04465 [Elusimicrobiota bacterium]|nr:hypothetical protein [Elusimicrobiota bacterium]